MARKPSPEERAFALGVLAGARRGRQAEQEEAIRDVAAGLLAEDVTEAVGLVEKHGGGALSYIANTAREVWPARWRAALGPLVMRVMRAAKLITDRGPVELSFDLKNPKLAQYFAGYMVELSGGVTETTREKVTDAIQAGLDAGEGIPEIAERVRLAGEEFSAYRSELIGRTEALRAHNGASLIQARESGVVKGKVWTATADSLTRPEHRALNGVEVPIDEPFPNGLLHPSEPNCRCTLTYNLDLEALKGRAG